MSPEFVHDSRSCRHELRNFDRCDSAAMAYCSEAERVHAVKHLEEWSAFCGFDYHEIYDKMLEGVRHDILELIAGFDATRGRVPLRLARPVDIFEVRFFRMHLVRTGTQGINSDAGYPASRLRRPSSASHAFPGFDLDYPGLWSCSGRARVATDAASIG